MELETVCDPALDSDSHDLLIMEIWGQTDISNRIGY